MDALWADFQARLLHAPRSLDDIYAWGAFFTFIGTVIGLARLLRYGVPVVVMSAAVAYRMPQVIRFNTYQAIILEDAAYLLRGSVLSGQQYVMETICTLVGLYMIGCTLLVLGVAPAAEPVPFRLVFVVGGFLVILATQRWGYRRRRVMQMVGTFSADQLPDLVRDHEMMANAFKTLPQPFFPFTLLMPSVEKARSRMLRASEDFTAAASERAGRQT